MYLRTYSEYCRWVNLIYTAATECFNFSDCVPVLKCEEVKPITSRRICTIDSNNIIRYRLRHMHHYLKDEGRKRVRQPKYVLSIILMDWFIGEKRICCVCGFLVAFPLLEVYFSRVFLLWVSFFSCWIFYVVGKLHSLFCLCEIYIIYMFFSCLFCEIHEFAVSDGPILSVISPMIYNIVVIQ